MTVDCLLLKDDVSSRMNPLDCIDPREGCGKDCFNAVIEISLGDSNKYEIDRRTGLLRLDRVLHSAVFYPGNYGFIPQTLAEDGDALDVLVLGSTPVYPLTIVQARAIGLMKMKDQNRADDKIIAVALGDPDYNGYRNLKDLPPHRLAVIRRFFKDYKALENKSVVVKNFLPVRDARIVFVDALKRFAQSASAR